MWVYFTTPSVFATQPVQQQSDALPCQNQGGLADFLFSLFECPTIPG
jgi:hypothetical protein